MVDLVPRSVLFADADVELPKVSPDGRRVAYLAPWAGTRTVWFRDLDDEKAEPLAMPSTRPVHEYHWARDGRHLLVLQDHDGDELFHLYAVDTATGGVRDLTPHDGVQAQVLRTSPRHPGAVLVLLNLDDPRHHDAHLVDVTTGARERVCDCRGVSSVVADADLRVRAGLRERPDGGNDVVVRDPEAADGSGWRVLTSWEPKDTFHPRRPVGVTTDGEGLLLLTSAGAGTVRLVDVDLRTGNVRRVLAEDDRYDIGDVVVDALGGEPLWAEIDRDLPAHVGVDEAPTAELDALAGRLGGEPRVLSRSDDGRVWTAQVERPAAPPEFWLHVAGGEPTRFPDAHPGLEGHRLADPRPFRFTARDGLELEGYLTLPPDHDGRPLPTVLWVHGGPWARDRWRYDPVVQLFANRGYACVQVNYRGSTGYGTAVLEAGNKQWGRAMSDDLLDAVEHLTAQGVVDRGRVAIAGGSYGGYAALAGAAFTPDAYACAVDVVGPSSLVTLLESIPPYWEFLRSTFAYRMGDVETERELLLDRSPLTHAAAITIPLLVVQGANDPRVPQRESDQIVAELGRNGVPHEYLLIDDEGHGFERPENMQRVTAAVERFLARHLGGRHEA